MRLTHLTIASWILLAGCGPMMSIANAPSGDVGDDAWDAPPVGVTIVRADDDRVMLSTNQPAYVALFELVPGRGVSMVYPVTPRQSRQTISGSQWVALSPTSARGEDRFARLDRAARGASAARHLYALASGRPLRMMDFAFDDDYLRRALPASAFRVTDAYETMGALSWHFLPAERDEDWGEDLFTLDAARVDRVTRVYCRDGSVVYVRDEMAGRNVCPWRESKRGGGARPVPPPMPDSVITSGGKHFPGRIEDAKRPAAFRVPRPTEMKPVPVRPRDESGPPTPVPVPRPDTLRDSGRGRGRPGGRDDGDRPGEARRGEPERPAPLHPRDEPGDRGREPERPLRVARPAVPRAVPPAEKTPVPETKPDSTPVRRIPAPRGRPVTLPDSMTRAPVQVPLR